MDDRHSEADLQTGSSEHARGCPLKGTTIGYCVPEFPSQTHAFFWREIQALRNAGVEVVIFSTRLPDAPSPHAFSRSAMAETLYLFPPRWGRAVAFLVARPSPTFAALQYALALDESSFLQRLKVAAMIPSAAELARICEKGGVRHVHIHSFANALHLGAMANILGGAPYSATLHGDLPVYGSDHAAKLRRASMAVAVTRPLEGQLATCSPLTATHVITMGVDVDRFAPAQTRSGPGVPDGALHVVSVARLNYAKGHSFFLTAMAQIVSEGFDIRYSIAGEGPHREAIETEIRNLGLGDRVEMMGSISEDRVLALLQSCDVFVLSSFGPGEAAPVAVMEAMSCGLAVICSLIGGTGNMIEDGRDGLLVAQRDIDGLAAALRMLAGDPGLCGRLGRAARDTACGKFDYRVTAGHLAEAIAFSLDSADDLKAPAAS